MAKVILGTTMSLDGFINYQVQTFVLTHQFPILFIFIWKAVMFWKPLLVLLSMIFGKAPNIQANYLSDCLGLSFILWLLPYLYMGFPFGLALLYPVTILAVVLVPFTSLRNSVNGNLSWKDRKIPKTQRDLYPGKERLCL